MPDVRLRTRWTVAFAMLALITSVACGSTTSPDDDDDSLGGTPPASDPRFTPVPSVTSLQLARTATGWMNFTGRPITISWNTIAGARGYVVEAGTSPGLRDVFSVSTTTTSLTRTFASPATIYPRITALIGSTSHPSDGRLPLAIISLRDYVEALFLGSGPLAQSPQTGCLTNGAMTGWPVGSHVTVTLAASLDAVQRQRATTAVTQASEAFVGRLGAGTRESGERHPTVGPFEIVAEQSDLSVPFACSRDALGCAIPLQFASPGQLLRAQIVMNGSSNRIGHEVGHTLYGFCHVATLPGFASIMGSYDEDGRGLSDADLEATRAVYGAGLQGGATRSEFAAAGLITP